MGFKDFLFRKRREDRRAGMKILLASCNDVGVKKQINQDSYCVRAAETPEGTVVMIVVCDGVGGLSGGELASADVVRAFVDWFEQELPCTGAYADIESVRVRWEGILRERNEKISAYGQSIGSRLGTTFTALFLNAQGDYLVGSVGDSRAYRITEEAISAVTRDHTVAAQAVRDGAMTEAEARISRKRNVLTQCVGATPVLRADYFTGTVCTGETWLLCSDGFCNRIDTKEMQGVLSRSPLATEKEMDALVAELVERCKSRGEADNITAVAMRVAAQ